MTNRLEKLLEGNVLIADGAMGTMIYQEGVFVNTCFDELNLTKPELIRDIHIGYINAGANFIETNTFGANGVKLSRYGLSEHVETINTAAVEIARQAVGESNVLIAGSVGPVSTRAHSYKEIGAERCSVFFSSQMRALCKAGVDFILLETFFDPSELEIAIRSARDFSLPVIAEVTMSDDHTQVSGEPLEEVFEDISGFDNVIAVGMNCSLGPTGMLESLKLINDVTDKPISVMPNAGQPREIDGRAMYMCTPEYMAEYAKRFFENGARIIGGCCGTTPDHIKEISLAVASLDKAMVRKPAVRTVVKAGRKRKKAVEPVSLAKRSKLGAAIAESRMISTVEITPPRGVDMGRTLEKVKQCADCGVDAINIPDGPRASSRLSPLIAALKIKEDCDIEPILHICCRDRNIIALQSDLLGLETMDLHNVLLITGDPPKLGEFPDATGVFDLDSVALTAIAANLNRGIDIVGNEFSPAVSLTLGVGANPVASEIHREIDRFKQKARAGAEYAVTQPVFDTEMFFSFQAEVEDSGLPIVAGIWPFTSYKNAEFMANEVPGVMVPKKILDRMAGAKTKSEGRAEGIKIAREMMEEISGHIAGFAVSAPFGNVNIALAVLGKMSIEEASKV